MKLNIKYNYDEYLIISSIEEINDQIDHSIIFDLDIIAGDIFLSFFKDRVLKSSDKELAEKEFYRLIESDMQTRKDYSKLIKLIFQPVDFIIFNDSEVHDGEA